VAPTEGVLPATGAGDGLGLLGVAGFALVLGGAATLLMRRRATA
jgi:LPXTG-motif cell wall-anchored protein